MDPQPWLSHYYTVNSGIFWILGRHFCILIYCAKFLFYLQVCVEYGSGRLSAVSRRKDLLLVEYGYPRLHRVLKCLTQQLIDISRVGFSQPIRALTEAAKVNSLFTVQKRS